LSCGKQAAEGPSVPPPAPVQAGVEPWSWHPLGGLAVIEGEVTETTELTLEGPSIREHRLAEPGPVRWEFFRPPEGESALLRDGQGRVLARFSFLLEKPKPQAMATRREGAPKPAPPPPVPAPTLAKTRTTAHPSGPSVQPLSPRRSSTLPATPGQTPALPLNPAPLTFNLRPTEPSPESTPALPAPAVASAWPGAGEALNLTRGRSGHKRILLSFDGGSTAEVATEVLDLLKARGIHTTLFLTGAFIQRFPALVRRMAAEGHELGNHTMNHPHFAPGMKRDPRWTRDRIQRELLDADAALVKVLGRPMDPYWRAPYGEHTAEIRRWAEEVGYRHVGWSEGADTLDWATPKERRLYRSGEAIVQRLEKRLNREGDGLIVLMHLGSERVEGDRPTKALGAFMDRALGAGWTFVTVGALLQDLGKPAWDGHRRMALLRR